mgnify:CR=1 FL=1
MRTAPAVAVHPTQQFPVRALHVLALDVIVDQPAYAPAVVDGTQTVQQWLWTRIASWHRALMVSEEDMAGYIGVRTDAPDGPELSRLLVHPSHRDDGTARVLVDSSIDRFGPDLRAVVVPGYPSHTLLHSLGWVETGPVSATPAVEPIVLVHPSAVNH